MTAAKKKTAAGSSPKSRQPQPVDLNKVRTYPVKKRANKVRIGDMANPLAPGGVERFLDSLPKQLKASELRKFIAQVASARKRNLPHHWMMGAHVIKVGLSPLVIDLLKRGIVTGVSFNGAGVIHDLELAFWGGTSEDVQSGLTDGSFGMARETGEHYREALELSSAQNLGLGEAAGAYIRANKAPHAKLSILAEAQRLGLPATIHLGVGSDIVAQHPSFSGALAGERSHFDFRRLATVLAEADRGGVVCNIGSAAVLPEVFLKALTVARNLAGKKVNSLGMIATANFDMQSHYRPNTNVVTRPTKKTGNGFEFIGHHEIMLPLVAWALKSAVRKK